MGLVHVFVFFVPSVFQVRMLLFAFCVNNFELYGLNNTAFFFAAKRPVRKTKENTGKQKKTCFFLFLFCLLPVGR